MDNEYDMDNALNDALAHSLEGNALKLKDVVSGILDAKALDNINGMKIDVAQSIYGTTNAMDPNDPEDFELPDDEADYDSDQDIEDLFAELEDLTDDEVEETGDDSDV